MTSSLISLAAAAIAVAGFRSRTLPTAVALLLFGVALLAAVLAVGLSAVRLARGVLSGAPVSMASLAALAIGLMLLLVPAITVIGNRHQARGLPPIHDITTDTVDPPLFVDVVSRRRPGENTIEYGGETVARQQRAAYPDLQPLVVDEPAAVVFARALTAVARGRAVDLPHRRGRCRDQCPAHQNPAGGADAGAAVDRPGWRSSIRFHRNWKPSARSSTGVRMPRRRQPRRCLTISSTGSPNPAAGRCRNAWST